MKLSLVCAFILSCVFPAVAVARDEMRTPRVIDDRPILNLLGKIEGPDGYVEITGHTRLKPVRPITQMTIAEVLEFQDLVVANGAQSSAMGRYQFIRKTLAYLVSRHNIDTNQLFNARTQDYLARVLLADCSYYDADATNTEIGNCLAKQWAALPVVEGANSGRSYYHGKAGNRALASTAEVIHVISRRFDERKVYLSSKPTPVSYPDDGRYADAIPLGR